MTDILLIRGDIVEQEVECVVNAANRSLLGGGGVDGAIHRVAGPELLADCRKLNGCDTGDAKLTLGHLLSAKYVIHTVGPVWQGGKLGEPELLANCYRNCLKIADDNNIRSVAFPSISTGAYCYPTKEACRIALGITKQYLEEVESLIQLILFVSYSNTDLRIYRKTWSELDSN